MGRKRRTKKRAAQTAAYAQRLTARAIRNETSKPEEPSQNKEGKPESIPTRAPSQNRESRVGDPLELLVSEPSKPPDRLTARVLKGLITAIGLIAAAIALYQIRPILSIATPPYMVSEKTDPLYVDFTISNHGHIGISDVRVFCWPAKTVYTNQDTLTVDPVERAKLLKVYSVSSIAPFKSFTARYAPLFELISFKGGNGHDRVLILGRDEMCVLHALDKDGHDQTTIQPCPMEVTTINAEPVTQKVVRSDVHVEVKYRWWYLPIPQFTSSFRFLIAWNKNSSTYVWEPQADDDPELVGGSSKFGFCLGCKTGPHVIEFTTPKEWPQ